METAERFSYYGFRAVLVLYFNKYLGFSESTSISLFAYTTSLAYFSPIFGAIISDSYLGRYNTILWFGIVYWLGLILLTLGAFLPTIESAPEENEQLNPNTIPLTFLGLFFICVGTGGIKPCVSAFGADQVLTANEDTTANLEEEANLELSSAENSTDEEKVQEFYAWFYFCINLGSVGSYVLVPTIRSTYGYGYAFLLSTIFLSVAMLSFISRRSEYIIHLPAQKKSPIVNDEVLYEADVEETVESPTLYSTFQIIFYFLQCRMKNSCGCFVQKIKRKNSDEDVFREDNFSGEEPNDTLNPQSSSLIHAPPINAHTHQTQIDEVDPDTYLQSNFSPQQVKDAQSALKVMPVLSMLPAFWMLYDQSSSVWTLQASHMELHGLQPEQLGAINPILIMILIPLFDGIIYPAFKRWNWNTSHLRRMAIGMFIASASFVVSGFVETAIENHDEKTINVAWQLPQILILSISEIFVSVTGLEFSYSYSPDSMKAMIMALYLLTTAIGDFFGGLLYTIWGGLDRALIMYICAGIMLINLFFFRYVEKWWDSSCYSRVPEVSTADLDNNINRSHDGQ